MSTKGKITFGKKSTRGFAAYILQNVTEGKDYPATRYSPSETDDLGQPGIDLPYYVFKDDKGNRVGYSKATYDTTESVFVSEE